MSQSDGGDLEILGTDSYPLPAQFVESIRRRRVKGNDFPFGKEIEQILQPLVGCDLLMNVVRLMNFGKPALTLFFGANDRYRDRLIRLLQAARKRSVA